MRFRPEVEDAIAQASARYGVPIEAMRAQAQLESGGNPNAQNPSSSAGGLYQFIDSTAKQYGLANKYDPYQSADAAGRLMRDNYNGLSNALGRAPTNGELYLAHQQGLGGATKLLTNPNAPASSLVGADAVRLNAGNSDMTGAEFAARWTNKADALSGGAAVPSGPVAGGTTGAGIAGLAAPGVSALPTVQEAQAQDPMAGVFGLLLQGAMSKQPAVQAPVPAPAMQRQADTRSIEEKMAATSQTPDVYIDRIRRQSYG